MRMTENVQNNVKRLQILVNFEVVLIKEFGIYLVLAVPVPSNHYCTKLFSLYY